MPSPPKTPRAPGRLAILVGAYLALGCAACGEDEISRRVQAPRAGVVGQVTEIRGLVTWSLEEEGPRTPLGVGDEIRAEWTVHTAPGAALAVRLRNGHLWTLSGDLSKRVSSAQALTLPPVREGALDWVADLGGKKGKDRTSAAGLYHERQLGTKASPTSESKLGKKSAEDGASKPAEDQAAQAMAEDGTPATAAREPDSPKAAAPRPPVPGSTPATDRPSGRGPTAAKPAQDKADGRFRGLLERGISGGEGGGKGGGAGAGSGGSGGSGKPGPRGVPKNVDSDPPPPPPVGTPRPAQGKPPERRPSATGEGQPSPETRTDRRDSPPSRRPVAGLREALNAQRTRIADVLKKQGLRGTQRVKVQVDGPRGRITAVTVLGRAPNDAVCQAVLRTLQGVSLPKAEKPFSVILTVVVP